MYFSFTIKENFITLPTIIKKKWWSETKDNECELLEYINEPTFSNYSHGVRFHGSIHSAIAHVLTWQSTILFIEGENLLNSNCS